MFDDFMFERYILSGNPFTEHHELEALAKDHSTMIRKRVAENPNTPLNCLLVLAVDACHEVRCAVAENPNAPVFLLELLADDHHADVRFWLADNPHTPPHILEQLTLDSNCFVAHRASRSLEVFGKTTPCEPEDIGLNCDEERSASIA